MLRNLDPVQPPAAWAAVEFRCTVFHGINHQLLWKPTPVQEPLPPAAAVHAEARALARECKFLFSQVVVCYATVRGAHQARYFRKLLEHLGRQLWGCIKTAITGYNAALCTLHLPMGQTEKILLVVEDMVEQELQCIMQLLLELEHRLQAARQGSIGDTLVCQLQTVLAGTLDIGGRLLGDVNKMRRLHASYQAELDGTRKEMEPGQDSIQALEFILGKGPRTGSW